MDLRELHWPLVVGLGTLALVRPVTRLVSEQLGNPTPAWVAVALTALVSLLWIAIVAATRVRRPVLTLTAAGMTYALLTILLSGLLSPILTGTLQGPLANPLAVVPLLLLNTAWGATCGALALAIDRLRRTSARTSRS